LNDRVQAATTAADQAARKREAAPVPDAQQEGPVSWSVTIGALRARDWLHFVALPLASVPLHPSLEQVAVVPLTLVSAAAALAFAYGLNAIADRRADDPSKNPLAGTTGALRRVVATVFASGALALAAAAPVGAATVGWVSLSLAAGALYSAGPRFKAVPGLGLVSNVAIFAPLLFAGPEPRPPLFGLLVTTFVALLVQNQLAHELADAAEDARVRALTTARALGPTGTRALVCAVSAAGAAAAAAASASGRAAVVAIVGLVVGAAVAMGRDPRRARRRHRVVAIAAGAALWIGTR
jgi:4-hydroxybenzoate polyprenyltransferase